VQSIETIISGRRPGITVVAAVSAERFRASREALARVARKTPLAIAGAGADSRAAKQLGTRYLESGPVEAAAVVTASPNGAGA
jgi:hypothetical protein